MELKKLIDELNSMREHLPDDYDVFVQLGTGHHDFELQSDGDYPYIQIEPDRYPEND